MGFGERWMEIEGRSEARALHPTARAWLRGRGAKGTGLGDSRDPLARTYHAGRGLVGGVIGVGEEDDTVAGGWLTCGAHVAAAAGEVKGVCGRERRAGWLRGPHAVRPGLLAAAHVGQRRGEKWRAGLVVWSHGLGRPACEAGL